MARLSYFYQVVVFLISCILATYVFAAEKPTRNKDDDRNAVINYRANTIWEINTAQGYNTTLVFPDNEIIQTVIIGTEKLWNEQHGNNIIYIKPVPFKLDQNDSNQARLVVPKNSLWTTNMIVATDKGRYQFELKVVDSKKELVDFEILIKKGSTTTKAAAPKLTAKQQAALKAKQAKEAEEKKFAEEQARNKRLAQEKEKQEKAKVTNLPIGVNWNYSMQQSEGDISLIKPSFIYDNNKNVYIGFSASKKLPKAYTVSNGKEKLSQSKVLNNSDGSKTIVVYGIHQSIILRYDNLVIQYNKNNKVE